MCLIFHAAAGASMFTIVSEIAQVDGFAPVFTQGGFVVPVDLATAFGAEVRSDGDSYTITYRGTSVTVRAGDERAITQAGERTLQPKPFVTADTLFVPLNFLADVLRLKMTWNPSTSFITLSPWTSPLSAFTAGSQNSEPQTPSLGPPLLLQSPPLPRPIASLEALFSPELPEASHEVADAPIESPVEPPEPPIEVYAGMWKSLHATTGLLMERQVEGGLVTFEFQGGGELEVTTAVLTEPFRLVMDVKGVESRPDVSIEPLSIGEGGVRQVRGSATPDGVRVVFDLDLPLGHKVLPLDDGRVGIQLLRPFFGIAVEAQEYGGRIVIDVPEETPYTITRLVQPDRIVIDLLDATLVEAPIQIEPSDSLVTRVRAAQFLPDVARVVLDVSEPVEIEPLSSETGIAFAFGDILGPIAYRAVEALGVDLRVNAGDDAEVQISRLVGPDRLVIDVRPMTLDVPLADAMVPSGPVYRIRASQHDADTVRIVADLKHYVQYSVQRTGRHTLVALRQPSLSGRTITVDPGHGGIDVGAISSQYGLLEKDVNLDISLKLRDLIAEADGGVHLTRNDDIGIGSSQRDGLMERVREASESESDIFVSVHNNSALVPGPTARGTETFFRSNDPRSRALAESVQSSVVSALGTVDRGIIDNQTRGYYVLRYIDKPAILVEVAFLSNPDEEELLSHDWFRQRAAEGIFNGLLKYFHPDDSVDDSALWSAEGEWQRMPARQQ